MSYHSTSQPQPVSTSKTVFKPKSTFIPQVNNPSVETVCRLVERDVMDLCAQSNKKFLSSNLLESERIALTESYDMQIKVGPLWSRIKLHTYKKLKDN